MALHAKILHHSYRWCTAHCTHSVLPDWGISFITGLEKHQETYPADCWGVLNSNSDAISQSGKPGNSIYLTYILSHMIT